MRQRLQACVKAFGEGPVGVVGDLIADIYIYGRPDRLSREAPVIIVKFEGEDFLPGGAANCVANLVDLGVPVYPVGVVGDDEHGQRLLRTLREAGAAVAGVHVLEGARTITKTRIMAGDLHTSKQQVIRIDRGPDADGAERAPALAQRVLEALAATDAQVAGWVVADYGYGVVGEALRARMAEIARAKPVVADSRHDLPHLRGVTLVAPNEGELAAASAERIRDRADVLRLGLRLRESLALEAVLVTRGNHGMILLEAGREALEIPIVGSRDIVDVSGAGDTVTSVMAAARVAGATYEEAARLATCAASVVVMKRGTATCSAAELQRVIEREFPA